MTDVEFRVAPWIFGEGSSDDPFPCDCEGMECVVPAHSGPVQDWFRRQEKRYHQEPSDV